MAVTTTLPAQTWNTVKSVQISGSSKHRHKPNPISPGFVPPRIANQISFGPTALAGAIARTMTLVNASQALIDTMSSSVLPLVRLLIANGSHFVLTADYGALADTARTHFAGQVGAGITDLMMNALGYAWRDNAQSISSTLNPHADFIYGGGASTGHGVVLAEARGSFSPQASLQKTSAAAKRKYLRQVRPHLEKHSNHGMTIHGYSIAFGSPFGGSASFLHVAETAVAKPKPSPKPVARTRDAARHTARPNYNSLILATYRSNFALLGADRIVRWIDWVRGGEAAPDDGQHQRFLRFSYAGRTFLAAPRLWHLLLGWPTEALDDDYWWPPWEYDFLSHPCRVSNLEEFATFAPRSGDCRKAIQDEPLLLSLRT